jgi:hypothetical protein
VEQKDRFECAICGNFELSHPFQIRLDSPNLPEYVRPALSAATKQENLRGRDLQLTPENYLSYVEAHRWTPVSRKLMKVLEVSEMRTAHFGAAFELDPQG